MKIKILYGLLVIDVLTILLVLAIFVIQSDIIRLIIGLPFLLFFPGYTLVASLFPRKTRLGGIERIALSFGMSVAIVALIGFGLNYTPWGIRLQPALYTVSAFIIVTSAIALIRQTRLHQQTKSNNELKSGLPGGGGIFGKSLTIILIVFILGALGVLGYTIANSKIGEKFTEFYILGFNGQAQDYPREFDMKNNQVTQVSYGKEYNIVSKSGKIILGIVNHEQQIVSYSVVLKVENEQVDISYAEESVSRIRQIELQHGEKWKREIRFAPQHIGHDQKVEFLLYKDGNSSPEDSLVLWINVKEAK